MPDNGNKQDDIQRHKSGRYKKGTVSPNPAGRPVKENSITGLLRKFAEMKGPDGVEYRERLVENLWLRAMNGDMRAVELVFNRCEGLLTQQIEQLQKVMVEYVNDWDGSELGDKVADTSAVPEDE